MKHVRVELEKVRRSNTARAVDSANVESLAASMKQIGLIQPIVVKEHAYLQGIMKDGFMIVSGNHRFLAAKQLGWTEIDAVIVTGITLETELIEIDENLCRSELSPAQRSSHIKRRKEIWEALHPEETGGANCASSLSDGRKKGPQHEQGFAASTADVSGESKSQINRHVARAEALGDDIDAVVGTSLDKGVELDALAKKAPEERKELIERAKAGEKVSARPEQLSEKPAAKVQGTAVMAATIARQFQLINQEVNRYDDIKGVAQWASELTVIQSDKDVLAAIEFCAELHKALHAGVRRAA